MDGVTTPPLTVCQQIDIAAPRQRVIEAWSEPEQVARWFVERRTGGARAGMRFVWYLPTDADLDTGCLAFENDGSVLGNATVLRVSASGNATTTRVRVEQHGFCAADQSLLPTVAFAWNRALRQLKAYVEGDQTWKT